MHCLFQCKSKVTRIQDIPNAAMLASILGSFFSHPWSVQRFTEVEPGRHVIVVWDQLRLSISRARLSKHNNCRRRTQGLCWACIGVQWHERFCSSWRQHHGRAHRKPPANFAQERRKFVKGQDTVTSPLTRGRPGAWPEIREANRGKDRTSLDAS
ncbi:hypothetical protein K461DRAFT_114379 [Myriangium duriaei CBS 260.36]|uniref:Uncharacterized protein n=1 Tax=Myriangium duriaei CBS 260.36 TaxID=1168546 RepID=A0A9P4MKZ7_9PEZI|nr:hypothetical protein K461DRAFT_114379 [Myriangium duriaei CBS 260.36]